MRVAGLIVGIIGGAFGLVCAIIFFFIGGLSKGLGADAEIAGNILIISLIAIIASIIGIIGGALATKKSRVAAVMMGLSLLIGFVTLSFFYIIPGVMLFVGAVLAWFGKSDR
jgi:hypothetical protein